MNPDQIGPYFAFFNEVGIINQLSTTLLEEALPNGMIAPHFQVLNHLVRLGDGRTPLQMARAFQVPKTSMTHTLAGLEKAGCITMAQNPDDKRSKLVAITDKGRAVRGETIERMVPAMAGLVAAFPPDQIDAVLPLLSDIRKFLDAARD